MYSVTVMMVTEVVRTDVGRRFTSEQVASIRLAVAQWMRSARAVAEARDALRALHVPPDEIFRRRRAESMDAYLAALLQLAVIVVITRGALEESDRRRFAAVLDGDAVQRVVQQAADAQLYVSHVERNSTELAASVDLDVGDY
jgi:sensor domain CHASE-containing protein